MTKEKVLWTALPNGFSEDQRLRISVFVAPRLSNADGSDTVRKLGEFAAFAKWPERLETIKFMVEIDGVTVEGLPAGTADPELWARFFPPDTPVRPYTFKDHARRNLHVFPVRGVLEFLQQTYGVLGAVGTDLPAIDDPGGPLAPFRPLEHLTTWITDSNSFYEELERGYQGEKDDGRVVSEFVADPSLPYDQQAAQNNFTQAYRFYYRPGSQRPDFPADYVEPRPETPEFDFHQMVAQLGDHPALLRKLGLIVDLIVDLPDPVGQVPAQGVVRVVPDGELPEDPPTCPGTRYELDERWFGAKPKDDFRMARGLLRLNPEFYDLFQVDVDGAAMQVTDFANTLGRMLDPRRRGPATPGKAGAPALRSAGLALARSGRGEQLLDDLLNNRDKNGLIEAGTPVVFDAEDLVRGYRVDVFDEDAPDGSRWFSLHQRESEYTVKDPQGASPPVEFRVTDEGYLKATSASGERADHPAASDDLYLHETIFGWEGWSLSAPRPGKRIVEPGDGDGGSTIARYDPEDDNPFPLVSRIAAAPRSLPRLRTGHTYRLRARTVDLAGNSRPFSREDLEPDEKDLVTEKETYLRFEPVASPTVLRRHLDTEGESLEHLVVRSNLGISAADYAVSPDVVDALHEEGALHTYAEDSQRHLAPPKTSQLMAEQAGRFDVAFGGTPAQMTDALRIALREEGTFLDEDIVDLTTGQKTVAQATISLHPPGTTLPTHRGDGLPGGAYAFYPDAEILLPYLPDPLAIGLSLIGYRQTGTEAFHKVVKFPGDWPVLAPLRLRLSEGPLGAAFSGGVLEVTLPKAEIIRARLSSVFPDGALEDLAIWDWIPDSAKTEALKAAALKGRHWMLTPFRWVTFTHAVQQPLQVPDMTEVTSARSLGSTFAVFRGPIKNHAKSTGRLDLFGDWTEDVDLLTDDEPRMRAFGTEVHHQAHALGFDIDPDEDAAQMTKSGRVARHEFGDTKYRRITYHSVATTRFREYLPSPIASNPERIQRVEPTTDQNGEVVQALVHHIPNSARPMAPDLSYVLPTFRWERQDEGDHRKHVRYGKAVRVWLRRPWFSSGDGEQLGIVLKPGIKLPRNWRWLDHTLELSARELASRAPRVSMRSLGEIRVGTGTTLERSVDANISHGASTSVAGNISGVIAAGSILPGAEEIAKMLRPYTTSWGSDPVWKSALPEQPPTVVDFPGHVGYAAGLSLDELPGTVRVNVAAHEVHYDCHRKLWYCDIEIDPGETYFPFVRLALARYQPRSVPNAHLSRVVMTDFVQLAPDRTAEMQLSATGAELTVKGYSGRNIVADESGYILHLGDLGGLAGGNDGPNTTVRAALERRTPGIPGDLGWERVGKEIILSPSLSGFYVTWSGRLDLPESPDDGYRIVITEVETHKRDMLPSDPPLMTTPADFVRERVVYADIFEL
ncbi:MAG: hypothetical protein ACK2UU_12370 [Anaerolineae bacterium]